MTTHTLPGRHISAKHVALAIAATGLAVGGAFAVTSWVADDGAVQAPPQRIVPSVDPDDVRDPSLDRLRKGPRSPAPGLPEAKARQLR